MSGMTHMEELWRVKKDDEDGSCDIVSVNDGWYVCNVAQYLPGDESGSETAQAIVDAHNKSLSSQLESVVDSAKFAFIREFVLKSVGVEGVTNCVGAAEQVWNAMVAACAQKEVK